MYFFCVQNDPNLSIPYLSQKEKGIKKKEWLAAMTCVVGIFFSIPTWFSLSLSLSLSLSKCSSDLSFSPVRKNEKRKEGKKEKSGSDPAISALLCSALLCALPLNRLTGGYMLSVFLLSPVFPLWRERMFELLTCMGTETDFPSGGADV